MALVSQAHKALVSVLQRERVCSFPLTECQSLVWGSGSPLLSNLHSHSYGLFQLVFSLNPAGSVGPPGFPPPAAVRDSSSLKSGNDSSKQWLAPDRDRLVRRETCIHTLAAAKSSTSPILRGHGQPFTARLRRIMAGKHASLTQHTHSRCKAGSD